VLHAFHDDVGDAGKHIKLLELRELATCSYWLYGLWVKRIWRLRKEEVLQLKIFFFSFFVILCFLKN